MNNKLFIIIFVLVVFVSGTFLYLYNPEPVVIEKTEEEGVACTMDAMLCPDGSYVGRIAPNCDFAPCPIPEDAIFEDGVILDENN